MKEGILPWLVCWACRASTRDCWVCLGCSNQPSTNIFFSLQYNFNSCVPYWRSKLGRQSCWVARLVVCVSGLSIEWTSSKENYYCIQFIAALIEEE